MVVVRCMKITSGTGETMRMRKKKNLPARMEAASEVLAVSPEQNRGSWLTAPYEKLWLELGCGKGSFTVGTAAAAPEALLVAVEKVPDAMVMAMEKAVAEDLQNVRFISMDAAAVEEIFAPGEVSRIYINFCDPWPNKRHLKRRLTAPTFLQSYARVLAPGGEIHFKTDNLPLFQWSLETLEAEGWETGEVTFDLHANGPVGVMTDYEAKFYAEGKPICRCVARKKL